MQKMDTQALVRIYPPHPFADVLSQMGYSPVDCAGLTVLWVGCFVSFDSFLSSKGTLGPT